MKHSICTALTLALLSGSAAAATESMQCPAPENITYENHIYTSPVTLSGWEGSWNSQVHQQKDIKRFVTALYFAKNKLAEGVLVNCTYELANGQEIDLTYSRKEKENILSNLIVSIEGNDRLVRACTLIRQSVLAPVSAVFQAQCADGMLYPTPATVSPDVLRPGT